MTGQYDRIEPLDQQDIIDMRREVTALRDRVSDLEQKVGVLINAAIGIQGGMEYALKGREQSPGPAHKWLGDLCELAQDSK